VFEPIRWNSHFGWRRMCERERLAWFHFWREVGCRMGIRDIPDRFDEFERYNVEYERVHFQFDEANRAVGEATMGMFCAWFPRPLRPVVRRSMIALMDEPLRRAMGFTAPSRWFCAAVRAALAARAAALRVLPRRRR